MEKVFDIFLKDANFFNHSLEGNHQISFYLAESTTFLYWYWTIDSIGPRILITFVQNCSAIFAIEMLST